MLALGHLAAKLLDLPAVADDDGLLGPLGAALCASFCGRPGRCRQATPLRRMIRDDDRARFFGHLSARRWRVGALLLRDDGVVAQLLELLDVLASRRI